MSHLLGNVTTIWLSRSCDCVLLYMIRASKDHHLSHSWLGSNDWYSSHCGLEGIAGQCVVNHFASKIGVVPAISKYLTKTYVLML
jgi:hypothetical protein